MPDQKTVPDHETLPDQETVRVPKGQLAAPDRRPSSARSSFPVPNAGCTVFGILNVTPDSFSDGGRYLAPEAAVAHGRRLMAEGADLIDVGGESTRPGAERVPLAEELRRVIPVIEALHADRIPVSVDTTRAEVAAAAVAAGAGVVNDVSGGLADPEMAPVIADTGVPYVLMHWRGHSTRMQDRAVYLDVVADVCEELVRQVETVLGAGVDRAQVILDPGLGFAKTAEHNWALLRRLDRVQALGFPVLVGASRKRFLGELLQADGNPRTAEGRDHATSAITALVAAAGVWGVRVHDVRGSADALAVWRRWSQ